MAAPMVRGHCIVRTSEFIQEHYDANTRHRIEDGYSFELRATLQDVQLGAWYPRKHFADMTMAIAGARDESTMHDDLVKCGRFIGDVGSNEFMKLAMKLLTPELLVKKLPRLWQRDYRNNGVLEVDATQPDKKRASLCLNGVDGFEHIGVTWLGCMKALFVELCGPGVLIAQQGWTTKEPAPKVVRYEVIWA